MQDLEAGGYVTHERSSGHIYRSLADATKEHAGQNDDVATIDMRDQGTCRFLDLASS